MNKPVFVITETFLSLVLAASVAAIGILAADIKTNGSILPENFLGIGTERSAKPQETQPSETEESEPNRSVSKVQNEKQESSKKAEESKQASSSETSKEESTNELNLLLEEPKDLTEQPKELTEFINSFNYDYDHLGFDHLIVVDTGDKSTAKVYCYEKGSKDIWWNIAGEGKPITEKGFFGENGGDYDIAPDSGKSPFGFYRLKEGFYIGEKPNTTYPLFEITDDIYWVDDPESEFYNQKVEGTDEKDWSSADHMISEESSYKYGLVIDFNIDPVDSKLAGSIFMHCGNAPTKGSVVVPEKVMKAILEWLDNDSDAYIFITTP